MSATLWDPPANTVIAVSRYSGVSGSDPIGSLVSGNTNGVDGVCSGGTDGTAYAFDLTTTVDGAVVYGAVAMRNRFHTPGSGYTERVEFSEGHGGDVASVATEDQTFATASSVTVDGSFNSKVDYAVIALEIKP